MPSPSPDEICTSWTGIKDNNFQSTIREAFQLPAKDDYVYRAESFAMTLTEVQEKLDTGTLKYTYQASHKVIEIPSSDIQAYTSIFSPSTDTSKTLQSFLSNAKKDSPRQKIATYLNATRGVPPSLKPSKSKTHINPYYDAWVFSCLSTGFVGPLDDKFYSDPANSKMTHPMLPVLYHHFGCVCPSFEALQIVKLLVEQGKADGVKGVLDMASGSGYWTFMLRRLGLDVVAVDNGESSWRYNWISDTVNASGVTYLQKNAGAKDRVLLMVYMVTAGTFTKSVLSEYKGDTVVVVGTMNANRYTGFRDCGVEEYFEKEMRGWERTVKIPLPSFAGKDDGMFVFQKKKK